MTARQELRLPVPDPITGFEPGSAGNELAVRPVVQRHAHGCWAACAEMILSYWSDRDVVRAPDTSQRAVISAFRQGSMAGPRGDTCDPYDDNDVSGLAGLLDVVRVYEPWPCLVVEPYTGTGALEELLLELHEGRPLLALREEVPDSWGLRSHMVVIVGWAMGIRGPVLTVLDPASGARMGIQWNLRSLATAGSEPERYEGHTVLREPGGHRWFFWLIGPATGRLSAGMYRS